MSKYDQAIAAINALAQEDDVTVKPRRDALAKVRDYVNELINNCDREIGIREGEVFDSNNHEGETHNVD